MAISKVSYTIEAFGAIVLLLGTASGLNQGESCPDSYGTCSRIENCPNRVPEVYYKYIEGNDAYTSYIRKYSCGGDDEDPLICCESPTEIEVIEDVSQHPNLVLLRQDICGPISQDRIAYGNRTRLFELPWMALIGYKKPFDITVLCAGTIISDRYVLTAAHCVSGTNPIYVRLGEHDLSTDIDCEEHFDCMDSVKICAPKPQDIPVEETIVHDNYTGLPVIYNDIALLRLSHPIDFSSDAVHPICLPTGLSQQTLNLIGKMVDIAGWGKTEEAILPEELLKATVQVWDRKKCPFFPTLSPVTQICAGGDRFGPDSCEGDSGGPLTYIGEVTGSIRTIQYGIVSYGVRGCGISGELSAFTHVGYYMKWILDNMKP